MFEELLGSSLGGISPYPVSLGQYLGEGSIPIYPQMLQNYAPQVCIHPGCPICSENSRKIQDAIDKKKTDYKNRCEEYMKRWRTHA
jgi:hypothetical protein